MKASNLFGLEIIDSDARTVGTVHDLEFDEKNWNVTSLIIKTGLVKRASVSTADVEKIGDKIILKITSSKIK